LTGGPEARRPRREEVEPRSSALTLRSYAYDLLRWLRFLHVISAEITVRVS
jgi:hypothetical protein